MDSISLRVHFPQKPDGTYENEGLFNALFVLTEANKAKYRNEVEFSINTVEQIGLHTFMKPMHLIAREMEFGDSERRKMFTQGRIALPSNHYDIGYRLNVDRSFCDFSFSVPKYLYGHSVSQVARNPHPGNRQFPGYRASFYDVSNDWYDIFHEVIRDFFSSTFIDVEINLKYVELIRIDFCFNQYFNSKEECFNILPYMAQKANTGLKGKSGKNQTFQVDQVGTNSFYIAGRNAYYKIYHKGTEFESKNGDKKKLIKRNEKRKDDYRTAKELGIKMTKKYEPMFDIEGLQKEADRILRHEFRFYPRNMSYYYKYYHFRKDCPEWQREKQRYKNYKTKLSDPEKRREVDKITRILVKETDKKMLQVHRFFLDAPERIKNNGKRTPVAASDEHYTEQYLSRSFFNYMINKTFEIVEGAQISEIPDWEKLKVSAQELNRKVDHELRKNPDLLTNSLEKKLKDQKVTLTSLRKMYENVKNYGSLDRMREEGMISKASYYRWRAVFSRLNLASSWSLQPFRQDLTFSSYFESIAGYDPSAPAGNNYKIYFSQMQDKHRLLF